MKLVDTNILMEKPSILERNDIIISIKVLKELDGLKRHTNNEVAEKARRAAIYISRRINELLFDNEDEAIPTDDLLLKVAAAKGYGIITNDVYLKIRAVAQQIETESYSEKDFYNGVRYIKAEEEELIASILQGEKSDFIDSMRENEYLIIQTEQPQFFRKSEDKLIPVRYTSIENDYVGELKPRNPEQVCLFDALNRQSNTIIYAGGGWGRGKSYILTNYALQELDKEHIKKIIYIPNNAFVANAMEIGHLPGTQTEKTLGLMGPILDILGIDRVQRYVEDEKIEIVPMAYLRGRSFLDSIIIVNEAQNLTTDHMKLLLARVGEGSRILLDGDSQ